MLTFLGAPREVVLLRVAAHKGGSAKESKPHCLRAALSSRSHTQDFLGLLTSVQFLETVSLILLLTHSST